MVIEVEEEELALHPALGLVRVLIAVLGRLWVVVVDLTIEVEGEGEVQDVAVAVAAVEVDMQVDVVRLALVALFLDVVAVVVGMDVDALRITTRVGELVRLPGGMVVVREVGAMIVGAALVVAVHLLAEAEVVVLVLVVAVVVEAQEDVVHLRTIVVVEATLVAGLPLVVAPPVGAGADLAVEADEAIRATRGAGVGVETEARAQLGDDEAIRPVGAGLGLAPPLVEARAAVLGEERHHLLPRVVLARIRFLRHCCLCGDRFLNLYLIFSACDIDLMKV